MQILIRNLKIQSCNFKVVLRYRIDINKHNKCKVTSDYIYTIKLFEI